MRWPYTNLFSNLLFFGRSLRYASVGLSAHTPRYAVGYKSILSVVEGLQSLTRLMWLFRAQFGISVTVMDGLLIIRNVEKIATD